MASPLRFMYVVGCISRQRTSPSIASQQLVKMTYRLARSMKKKDSQFITVISGCDVSDEDAEKTTELVRAKCGSSVEVSHISGGQPVYYYMISVE